MLCPRRSDAPGERASAGRRVWEGRRTRNRGPLASRAPVRPAAREEACSTTERAAARERPTAGGQMNATATITPGPQYMRALAKANEVRLARADLKRRVATGEISAAEVVLTAPWQAESMTIADLLMSQRRWGSTRCRKLLAQVPVSENKTVGSMTDRQRQALAFLLEQPTARPSRAEAFAPALAV